MDSRQAKTITSTEHGILANKLTSDNEKTDVSLSPSSEVEAGEFTSVPESFNEIMTPRKDIVGVTNGCQHRLGRKPGKACVSCMNEKKGIVPDVLQITPARTTGGGELQNGTTRIPYQKLCEGLRRLNTSES
ncbi:unnamed protein product [Calypogeia fissa]